jgi:dihydrofolate reductase
MRRLVLKMSITLDGFVCGPNGEIDWIFRSFDPQLTAWTVNKVWQAGVHLMGSRVFRDMAAWWPYSTEPFAPPMNHIPKAVYSSSGTVEAVRAGGTTPGLQDAARATGRGSAVPTSAVLESWTNPTVLKGDLAAEIARLKRQPGKDIVAHGGARFAQCLVAIGVIDEYQLIVHPVALRRGQPLFSGLPQPVPLELVSATVFPAGAIAHVYRPQPRETESQPRIPRRIHYAHRSNERRVYTNANLPG